MCACHRCAIHRCRVIMDILVFLNEKWGQVKLVRSRFNRRTIYLLMLTMRSWPFEWHWYGHAAYRVIVVSLCYHCVNIVWSHLLRVLLGDENTGKVHCFDHFTVKCHPGERKIDLFPSIPEILSQTVFSIPVLCSVYQAPPYEPRLILLAPFST